MENQFGDSEIWRDDVLGRKNSAEFLHNFICNRQKAGKDQNGFVLALNSEWGMGKTFLIKKWHEQLLMDGYPSVLFDAWQNDFTPDPLLAFISEINKGLEAYFKKLPITDSKVIDNLFSLLKKSWKPVLKIIGMAALKHGAGISVDHFRELISLSDDETAIEDKEDDAQGDQKNKLEAEAKELAKKLEAEIDKILKSHTTISDSITKFKIQLEILVQKLESEQATKLPFYIFIDELDRCRPDYAIELLEGIKHLFGVPGVYFIVATNVGQLAHSVKAIYGNGFDGQRYLRRFFDLQYALPEPNNAEFVDVIFNELYIPKNITLVCGLDQGYFSEDFMRGERTNLKIIKGIFVKHVEMVGLELRDQVQIVNVLESALSAFENQQVHIFFLIFLIVIYQRNASAFKQIRQTLSLKGIIESASVSVDKGIISYHETLNNVGMQKQISMINIADAYLTGMTQDISQNNRMFPTNMLVDTFYSLGGQGKTLERYFEKYFEVVQHAGEFKMVQ